MRRRSALAVASEHSRIANVTRYFKLELVGLGYSHGWRGEGADSKRDAGVSISKHETSTGK